MHPGWTGLEDQPLNEAQEGRHIKGPPACSDIVGMLPEPMNMLQMSRGATEAYGLI